MRYKNDLIILITIGLFAFMVWATMHLNQLN